MLLLPQFQHNLGALSWHLPTMTPPLNPIVHKLKHPGETCGLVVVQDGLSSSSGTWGAVSPKFEGPARSYTARVTFRYSMPSPNMCRTPVSSCGLPLFSRHKGRGTNGCSLALLTRNPEKWYTLIRQTLIYLKHATRYPNTDTLFKTYQTMATQQIMLFLLPP